MTQLKNYCPDNYPRSRSQFGTYLNALGLRRYGIEIGVCTGGFSEKILKTWSCKKFWLVDPWRHLCDYFDSYNASDITMERRLKIAKRRLVKWRHKLEWLRLRSDEAVYKFPDQYFDFIYLDANHSYFHVSQDLKMWYPKIRNGGIFAGHDYFNAIADEQFEPLLGTDAPSRKLTSYGVKAAVEKFMKEQNLSIRLTWEKYPTWYFEKPFK